MQDLLTIIDTKPDVINLGVRVLDEQLYDVIFDVMMKLRPDMEEEFTDSEYRYVERYILKKCLEKSTIFEITNQAGHRLEIDRNCGFPLEIRQNLILEHINDNEYRCIGVYDRHTGEKHSLTEEKKDYARNLGLEVV